jgi:hypothetical protein
MTASAIFDVIFVGAGHNALIAAHYLAEDSGSVCLLDQRPMRAKPRTASSECFLDNDDENYGRPKKTHPRHPSSESFMDDPDDFKKRSRTGSPYENRPSHPTCGQPNGEHHTATKAVIASITPDSLYQRPLRDAPGIPESTRPQGRRYQFRRGCVQINLALSAPTRFADSRLDGGGGINVGRRLNELITSTRQEDHLLPTYPWIPWRARRGRSRSCTQRPIPAHRGGYTTAVPDLYQIGAASWPGRRSAARRVGPSLEAY